MIEIYQSIGRFNLSFWTSPFSGEARAREAAIKLANYQMVNTVPAVVDSIREHELEHALADEMMIVGEAEGLFVAQFFGVKIGHFFHTAFMQQGYGPLGFRTRDQLRTIAAGPAKLSPADRYDLWRLR